MSGPLRVLVVAAHPDDEVLGCGGTVAMHASAGDEVNTVIVAEGATSRAESRAETDAGEVSALAAAAAAAAEVLGARPPRMLGLPDNRLDSLNLLEVIKPIEAIVEELSPAVVYTHFNGDLNVDHRIVFQAVATACRPMPGSPVKALYCFETPSSSEWGAEALGLRFQPNRFRDISAVLETKMEALRRYESEMRPFPHARSYQLVESLARVRGGSVGVEAAEGFQVIREVV